MENETEYVSLEEWGAPKDSADVAKYIGVILNLQKNIEGEKEKTREAVDFYRRRIANIEKNIEYLTGQIDGYLKYKGEKSLSTFAGSAIRIQRTEVDWPEDDELVEWAKSLTLPGVGVNTLIRYTESPNKREIAKVIVDHGIHPPGYQERPTEKISIRAKSD